MGVLNDDDALDLFKKTLPSASASFVQTHTGLNLRSRRDRVVETLRKVWGAANAHHRPGLDFLVLALTGRRAMSQGTFDKVIKMIDNMVAELKKEQADDDSKLEYCQISLDKADDKKKSLERSVEDLENEIEKAKDMIATLTDEIKALESGIVDLDKSVVEATEQRKAENEEFKSLMVADGAGKDLCQSRRSDYHSRTWWHCKHGNHSICTDQSTPTGRTTTTTCDLECLCKENRGQLWCNCDD